MHSTIEAPDGKAMSEQMKMHTMPILACFVMALALLLADSCGNAIMNILDLSRGDVPSSSFQDNLIYFQSVAKIRRDILHNRLNILALIFAILCGEGSTTEVGSTATPEAPVVVGSTATPEAPVVVGSTATPEAPVVVGSTATPEAPVVVGSTATPEAPVVVGSTATPEVPVVVGSTATPEVPVVVGSTATPEAPIVVGSTATPEVPVVVGSTATPEASLVVGSTATPEASIVVGSTATPEVPVVVGSSLPKDPVVVGSSLPKDPVVVGSSLPKDPVVVGSSLPKDPVVVGSILTKESIGISPSDQENLTSIDSSPLETITIIGSQFNPDLGESFKREDSREFDNGEFNPLIRGLLKDNYMLEELMESILFDIWATQNEYYNQRGTKFVCDLKDIINLFGNGLLSDVLPKDPGCCRKAAYAEWLLECHGISANIIVAPDFFGKNSGHAWVEVPAHFNETYYIDLSRKQNYIVIEDAYNTKYGNNIKNYWVFKDIYHASKAYNIKKFAWWCTEWGSRCLKNQY